MEGFNEKKDREASGEGVARPGRRLQIPETPYVKPEVVASYSERELDSQFSTAAGAPTHVDLFEPL